MPTKAKSSTALPATRKTSKIPGGSHKKVKTPKPPRPVEEQLQRYFTSLCAQIDGGFVRNAIKTCDRILRILPNDEDTVRTKLFLLLQSDRYAEALSVAETPALVSSPAESSQQQFDRAYVLYRLRREDDANEILTSIGDVSSHRGLQHLEAQLKYRNGEYQISRDLYNTLLDTCEPNTDEYSDILTNIAAVQKHLDFLEKGYLQAIHSLPTSVAALESAPPPALPSSHSVLKPIVQAASATSSAPAPAKAPRKSRIPKHVVLGVTPMPDPERWLKKRERTRVEGRSRRKGKAREGMGVGATQGSVIGDSKGASAAGSNLSGHAKKGKKGR